MKYFIKHLTANQNILWSIFFVLFTIFLFFFNSQTDFVFNKNKGLIDFEKAVVLEVLEENLKEYEVVPKLYLGTQELQIKVLTGEKKNNVYQVRNTLSRLYNVHAKKGTHLIVSIDTTKMQQQYISIYTYDRANIIYGLVIIFFALLIILGGMKGLKSVFSLVFTLVCVVFLFVPLIFRGYSPILSAVWVTILTTFVTLFLLNGWSYKTASAVFGTALGVIIAGLFASISGSLSHISTLNTSEAETLIEIATDTHMQVRGILFAGILVASLGAVMDVGMSIASAMSEIYKANPKMKKKGLFLAGMNVGKDMMGTMSNTLILAFAGGSLNTMILFYAYNMPYYQLMNIDYLSVELIQGLSGSIAVVLCVPITAVISAILIPKEKLKK